MIVVTEINQSYLPHPQLQPSQSPLSHSSPPVVGTSMFSHLHLYGAQYHLPGMAPLAGPDILDHIQIQGQHNASSSSSFPRATYYPVIDPQIDVPQAQANISSERYDPSSVTTDPRAGSV